MYESPLHLLIESYVKDIQEKQNKEIEEYTYNYIQTIGIDIDKDELIKALNYDRNQYEKGYREGYQQALRRVSSVFADDEYIVFRMKQRGMFTDEQKCQQ